MAIPVWRQIQKENFTRFEPLLDFLELGEDLRKKIVLNPRFSLNLPRRLASKIAKNTLDDPILRQFVPLEEELRSASGFLEDPLQDKQFQKTKKILHKYNSRALILASSACAMHCRFCFRQNFPYETQTRGFDEELTYLANNTSISEVILSGGDPLSLGDEMLTDLFAKLEPLAHVRRIRFHTRFPIGIPERIDPSFLDLLSSSSKQIYFIIHCNHPKELDRDVAQALQKIRRLGIPVLNQSVLLKGVNNSAEVLLELSETLINAGILPYYLHELDPVLGTAHFQTSRSEAAMLIQSVQENLSGFGVPRLVKEEPGQPSKTFITSK